MTGFGELNLEDMAGEDARLESAGTQGFLDQFVPMPEVRPGQVGSVTVRILPPAKGDKLFQYTRIHTIKGRKLHCPRPLNAGKWDHTVYCPICEYYSALWKSIDKLESAGATEEAERLKTEARSLKPVERYYYNAIVRKMTDSEGNMLENQGPRILSVGKILHQRIIRAFVGDPSEPALGDVTHVKNGYDFVIRKEVTPGKDQFPNYNRSSFARESSLLGNKEEIEKWQTSLHDLKKLRPIKDADFLEKQLAIHRGLIADDEEGFNVDNFDAKFKKAKDGEVEEIMKSTAKMGSSVSVPANVPAAAKQAAKPAAKAEDMEVDSDKFFASLEEADLDLDS